tara:strand:- start:289 stop:1686 length:1398 start_codon:yes stop_codon:yes gene_type:complete
MKRIDRYIFKEHLIPFALSLLVLLFILLANFMLKSIDKFLGKGLSLGVLAEYLFYNMAWILALAVPMAVLIATLTAFGRFSADNEITAMRATGISTIKLLRAPLLFGIVVTCVMTYFNNQILPDMNHNARSLSVNISKKRPDLEFAEGLFTEAIPNYSIYVNKREEKNGINHFYDINIFNNKDSGSRRTITAEHGTIESINDGVILHLDNGQIHELMNKTSDYTQIDFEKYDIAVPIENLALQRKNLKSRGDREMDYSMMVDKIDDIRTKRNNILKRIKTRVENESFLNVKDIDSKDIINEKLLSFEKRTIDSLSALNQPKVLKSFKRRVKNLKRGINNDFRLLNNYENSINRYLVELHKKFSIPFASIVFILVGAPLGVMARRGNFALSTTISLGFFIIYWAFLIGGEQLADRGTISPFMSMWLPNIILGALGLYLIYINSKDRKKIRFEMFNLIFKRNKSNDS